MVTTVELLKKKATDLVGFESKLKLPVDVYKDTLRKLLTALINTEAELESVRNDAEFDLADVRNETLQEAIDLLQSYDGHSQDAVDILEELRKPTSKAA